MQQNYKNANHSTPQDHSNHQKHKIIAHCKVKANHIVFVSCDLETGCEYCVIIQLSAEIFCPNPFNCLSSTFIHEHEVCQEYIRPPDCVFWKEEACRASHSLSAASREICSMSPFFTVWVQTCNWISCHVGWNKKCVLISYQGDSCDIHWIWKHNQAPWSQLCMPPQIVHFMDSLEVINSYTSCKFYPNRSKLDSLDLGCLWQYITKHTLNVLMIV